MFTKEQFAKMLDSTMLKPTATKEQIYRVCEEAKIQHFAAVCVFPFWVSKTAKFLAGSDIKVCTVIGFPFGMNTTAVKAYEAKNAILQGANEIDTVMNIAALKAGDLESFEKDIRDVVETVHLAGMTQESNHTLVKIILETFYLTDEEKVTAAKIIKNCGADFIKTSTGTTSVGATVQDVKLIRRVVGPDMGVKASGGIRTVNFALDLIDAGANRIGTSSAPLLMNEYNPELFEVG